MGTTAQTTQNGHVPWNEKLLVPFENDEIGVRPQVWCSECRKAIKDGGKACGKPEGPRQHKAQKCAECGQNLTTAHLHLFYVGHADLTQRLLDADPYWTWEPLARDTDPEILKAAIASGNPEIVKMVLDSSPPKMEEFEVVDRGRTHVEKGMWMRLILHDDQGQQVTMIGFGDAKGKDWQISAPGDVIKEIIGDGLRNAGMRRGAALDLWRRRDREQARQERQQYDPRNAAKDADMAAAGFSDFGEDGKAIGSGQPPTPDPDAEAQAAIEAAWVICERKGDPGAAIDEIRDTVHRPASRVRGRLAEKVRPPWAKDAAERIPLSAALTHVKNVLEMRQDKQALAARQAEQAGSGA